MSLRVIRFVAETKLSCAGAERRLFQVLRAPDSIDLLDADETLSQLAALKSGEPLSMIGLDL
jgi:hypothetical protein